MFKPAFCPNPKCRLHRKKHSEEDWYVRNGSYWTKLKGSIPRFICTICGKGFSSQTFHIDYYTKKGIPFREVVRHLSESSSNRGMGRLLGCTANSIQNRIDRLSRFCIEKMAGIHKSLPVKEDLCADGFESFAKSKYFPNNINILVGAKSQFVYFMNHVALKRKGAMTDSQKKKRNELYKTCEFTKGRMKDSFKELIEYIDAADSSRPITLRTDMKTEYAQAIKEINEKKPKEERIRHHTVSSRKTRDTNNPLFSVNYTDREIRKDLANHRRKTTCYARKTNNMLNRMYVYFAHHNFTKRYRLNGEGRKKTHAQVAGIGKDAIANFWQGFKTGRGFRKMSGISGSLDQLWVKSVPTPYHEKNVLPKYAFK